ncbi:MAG: 50S ribosomal protein L20 [Candidatus Riflebacteria bacterium]|nr:50S ribosomal protein L20 [Candidatus Riflebacteria bacterium]
MRTTSGPVTKNNHRKILKMAKGYRNGRSNLFKRTNEAVISGLKHAYKDRKAKKAEYRSLWIVRINAAVRALDAKLNYSLFMSGLRKKNIEINRKVLAELAVNNQPEFSRLLELAKG